MTHLKLFILFLASFLNGALGATYYVDGTNGLDTNGGTSGATSFKTLQKAGNTAKAGDSVIVASGLYAGNTSVFCSGTAGNPVTWKAANRPSLGGVKPDRATIISGADNNQPSTTTGFRGGAIPWTDTGINHVFKAPCNWLPYKVLCDNQDLYPYPSLADLQSLRVPSSYIGAQYASGPTSVKGINYPTYIPGPHGGYYASGTTIYVRLDSSHTGSSLTPATHRMVVGNLKNGWGFSCSSTKGYNIVDGFILEGVGAAGLTVKGPGCVIQNCLFVGCTNAIDAYGQANLTVKNCEVTCDPAFDDAQAAYKDYQANSAAYTDPGLKIDPWNHYLHWARKKPPINYGRAFLRNLGANCVVSWNYIHDGVDAISSWGVSNSSNLIVSDNYFARMADNGLEVEDHSIGLKFTNNRLEDCYEPISIQPLGGPPYPAAITIAHNVIYDTRANQNLWYDMWRVSHAELERAVFKLQIMASPDIADSSLAITGGVIIHNNTIAMKYGVVADWVMPVSNAPFVYGPMAIFNNYIADTYGFFVKLREAFTNQAITLSGLSIQNNVVAPSTQFAPGPGDIWSGANGASMPESSGARFTDEANGNFVPLAGSFLISKGLGSYNNPSVPLPVDISATVGAFNVGDVMPALSSYGIQPGSL